MNRLIQSRNLHQQRKTTALQKCREKVIQLIHRRRGNNKYVQCLRITARLLICFLIDTSETGSSSYMIRDTVTYLCPDKRKTAAFGKFGFIFGEQKSTFTLS